MGRPINKRYFGSGAGNQIKVRAKIGNNAEGDGFIVSQRSTNKFKVTVGANTGICKVVNKSNGELAANEMIINVMTDGGIMQQATKLYNRVAIVEGNHKVKWNFSSSLTDGAVQVPDVEGDISLTITIDTQPADVTVEEGADATFTVEASGVGDLVYKWEVSDDSGASWADVPGGSTDTLVIAETVFDDHNDLQYRVVVSSQSGAADSVTSTVATLTVTQ